MSPTQRVIASISAGIAVMFIMFALGLRPNPSLIALAIAVTAMITQKFRNDKD